MSSTAVHNPPCANCGSHRAGQYCAQCGQNDRHYQRSLPPLVWDLLRETFELDSRLLKTVRSLLFRPGELAVEFSHNRRASYVSPIRLYLFVSLFFFFLLSFNTEFRSPAADVRLDSEMEQVADVDVDRFRQIVSESHRPKVEEILKRENSIARLALLQLAEALKDLPEPPGKFGLFMLAQTIDVLHEPRAAAQQLFDNLSVAVFIMLPVFALLLSLFYLNRHRYYVENLVFATHLHTFAFLVFTLMLALPEETANEAIDDASSLLNTVLILGLVVYHLLALKRYYEEGWIMTLIKFTGQMGVYFSLLVPAVFLLVALFTLAAI